jgi:hypothetical protein
MVKLFMFYPMLLSQSIRASLERVTQITIVLVLMSMGKTHGKDASQERTITDPSLSTRQTNGNL